LFKIDIMGGSSAPSSTAAARKAGAAAAGRLFRSAPKPPRALRNLNWDAAHPPTTQLSVGPVFDVVVPSAAMAPCCLCCGTLLAWQKLASAGSRLPLARGGFYACCDACDRKNQAVFTKEWQTVET
jgi:hypothetical protein